MIDILLDDDIKKDVENQLPSHQAIESAIQQCCKCIEIDTQAPQVCIRFAHNDEVQSLNAQWRNKDKVTDVLSFPMQEGEPYQANEPLGDIIIAMPFVLQEAERLQRDPKAHVLHLIIHGMLHLVGYDHIHDDEAKNMQTLESEVMGILGLHQPYADHEGTHA